MVHLGAIGAVLTILAAGIVVPALPYLLSFAAGAMLYVVVEALIPEMSQGGWYGSQRLREAAVPHGEYPHGRSHSHALP